MLISNKHFGPQGSHHHRWHIAIGITAATNVTAAVGSIAAIAADIATMVVEAMVVDTMDADSRKGSRY